MAIIITIKIDIERSNDRGASFESIGRELAREAGFRTRLPSVQYAALGRDFSNSIRRQLEHCVSRSLGAPTEN